jgi:hypothetical protein
MTRRPEIIPITPTTHFQKKFCASSGVGKYKLLINVFIRPVNKEYLWYMFLLVYLTGNFWSMCTCCQIDEQKTKILKILFLAKDGPAASQDEHAVHHLWPDQDSYDISNPVIYNPLLHLSDQESCEEKLTVSAITFKTQAPSTITF